MDLFALTSMAYIAYTVNVRNEMRRIEAAQQMVKIAEAQWQSQSASLQDELRAAVKNFCAVYPGSLRDLARETKFSVAYLSDIVRGRRNVSDEIVKRFGKIR